MVSRGWVLCGPTTHIVPMRLTGPRRTLSRECVQQCVFASAQPWKPSGSL